MLFSRAESSHTPIQGILALMDIFANFEIIHCKPDITPVFIATGHNSQPLVSRMEMDPAHNSFPQTLSCLSKADYEVLLLMKICQS